MASPVSDSADSLVENSARKRTAALLFVAFGVVYLIWGSTYLAMRIGIESFPPLLLPGSRHLLVGLVLYPLMRWKTGERPTLAQWRTAAITGTLLLFFGNGGVCYAEQTVPSGVAALLVATVSLWMVIVDWLRPGGARPAGRVFIGIVLGFLGLALLVGPAHLGGAGRINLVGAGVLVVASFAWACGSVFSKHGALPRSPMLGVAMQALAGGVVLWIAGFFSGEMHSLHFATISLRSWLALAYLVFFGSVVGFTSYLYMLKNTTAARVGTYALVNPVVALLLGWLFASEPISLRTLLAAAIILSSVLLVITAPAKQPEGSLVPAGGEAD
ncbi:MAG TPA: EamA family transporter [Candidatus Acidoferrales bacterium]|nr:EamA family transporter [Candidatus Acidoferrales bacterium]